MVGRKTIIHHSSNKCSLNCSGQNNMLTITVATFKKKHKNETAMPDDDWSAIKLAKHMNPSEKTGCTAWEMMKTMSDKDGDAQCKEQLELSPV